MLLLLAEVSSVEFSVSEEGPKVPPGHSSVIRLHQQSGHDGPHAA